MNYINRFLVLPEDGQIPICDINGKLRFSYSSEADINLIRLVPSVSKLPNVSLSSESMRSSSSQNNAYNVNELFLPSSPTRWDKIQNAWYDNGVIGAINAILETDSGEITDSKAWYNVFSSFLLKFANYFSPLTPTDNSEDMLFEYSQVRNWQRNQIRCIEWHPYCTKFAVVTKSDVIHIYVAESIVNPVLKHKFQRNITCVTWRPLSASELAVGCEAGIYIWDVDPNSVITRPSPNAARLLSKPNHNYVTSIAWNNQGTLLVSSSLRDRTMYIWHVSLEYATPITKYNAGFLTFVTWSPNSEYVFSATTSTVFRIWATENWCNEKWYVPAGRVRTACWSPCGSVLLFATTTESSIFAITLSPKFSVFRNPKDEKMDATRVADLTKQELSSGEVVGGEIMNMIWDPKSQYLAVIFKDTNLIAVFSTVISTNIYITPKYFLKGREFEVPNAFCFQTNFEEGSNLVIAWSSGRIQYFPFYKDTFGTNNALPSLSSSTRSPDYPSARK